MMRQIAKMMMTHEDPKRQARELSTNLAWNSPIFSIAFALGKITRVVQYTGVRIRLTARCPYRAAEECREAAHYLLRAAEMLEGPSKDQELPS